MRLQRRTKVLANTPILLHKLQECGWGIYPLKEDVIF